MTQKYREDGAMVPVTKISAEPCIVTQVKMKEKDGYSALQIGGGKRKHFSKPLKGHLKDINVQNIKEFRIDEGEEKNFQVGDVISVSIFSAGDRIKLTGISKGKGFQGVVKRHHFAGSPKTRGHKDQLRMPGSSGAGGVQHVLKGKRMPGRMGQDQVTLSNIEVVEVDPAKNEIYVKGAVPGARNSLVWIRSSGEMKIERPAKASVQEQEVKTEVLSDAQAEPKQ